jgi:general secretion pathway protein L
VLLRCVDPTHFMLPDGRVVTAEAILAALPTGADTSVCALLLPASLCSITELAVGAGEAALLRKTLPWRLEESLLVAPELLHFAHSAVSEGRVAVTLVDKAALHTLRATLAAAGLTPGAIHAELSVVPWQPRQWSVWADAGSDGQLLVRHGWHQGFACISDNLVAALALLQNEQQTWPEQIVFYGSHEQAAAVQTLLPAPLQNLLVVRKPPGWDELLVAQTASCNVLQGAFAPPLPWARWWQQWRLPAALLAALLLVDGIATAVTTWHVQTDQRALQQDIITLYRQVEPQGTLVDPTLQLRELVNVAGGNAQQLLPLLSKLAPVLASEPASQVAALDFDGVTGELQLELRSNGLGGVENLRSKLQAAGLVAELVGSTSEGGNSRARLRVVAL